MSEVTIPMIEAACASLLESTNHDIGGDAMREALKAALGKPDPIADLCTHIRESIRLCPHGYIHITCGDCQRRD